MSVQSLNGGNLTLGNLTISNERYRNAIGYVASSSSFTSSLNGTSMDISGQLSASSLKLGNTYLDPAGTSLETLNITAGSVGLINGGIGVSLEVPAENTLAISGGAGYLNCYSINLNEILLQDGASISSDGNVININTPSLGLISSLGSVTFNTMGANLLSISEGAATVNARQFTGGIACGEVTFTNPITVAQGEGEFSFQIPFYPYEKLGTNLAGICVQTNALSSDGFLFVTSNDLSYVDGEDFCTLYVYTWLPFTTSTTFEGVYWSVIQGTQSTATVTQILP